MSFLKMEIALTENCKEIYKHLVEINFCDATLEYSARRIYEVYNNK